MSKWKYRLKDFRNSKVTDKVVHIKNIIKERYEVNYPAKKLQKKFDNLIDEGYIAVEDLSMAIIELIIEDSMEEFSDDS